MKHGLSFLISALVATQAQALPAAGAGVSFFSLAGGSSGLTTMSLLAAGLIALGLARHRAK